MSDLWDAVYPRPQLKRESFFPLSEGWSLHGRPIPAPWTIETFEEDLRYLCKFRLPEGFAGEGDQVFLHFGAVDQVCSVRLNNRYLGKHEGGYLPFEMDITNSLRTGENELYVDVKDDLSLELPYGKQTKTPGGMWYTPVSGIWQQVWIEAVPAMHRIRKLKITPDLTGATVEVLTDAKEVEISLWDPEGKQMISGAVMRPVSRIPVTLPMLWTPEHPNLYRLRVSTDTDRVESYFALRTVEVKSDGVYARVYLNGEPVFLNGVLDQGYYQDTVYLPRDPAEYERDILRMKELGFNTLRKHIKIEPEVFYERCDRLGMLVIQDMVNSGEYRFMRDTVIPTFVNKHKADTVEHKKDARRRNIFQNHMQETIRLLYNHPCIIGYTIFNEGWGQFHADRMYETAKKTDATRFYDSTSGWFIQKLSDAQSEHIYYRNKVLRAKHEDKFLFLSECGGFSREVPGHASKKHKHYGYGRTHSKEALTAKIEQMYRAMVLPSIKNGLCGVILTQLSDVEGELNGLYTYDREVCKVSRKRVRAASASAFACFRHVVETGKGGV